MKAYKLTNQDNLTQNHTLWGDNITHTITNPDQSQDLCSGYWLHYYDDPYLAVFFNPPHADIENPKLWLAEANGLIKSDKGMKYGCTELTTIKEIELPVLSDEQIVGFAILCAKEVCEDKDWLKWSDGWLSGKDRTIDSAKKAYNNVYDDASAAYVACKAAYYAYYYVYNAAYYVYSAYNAAYYAAYYAYEVVYYTLKLKPDTDLKKMINKALKLK